MKDLNFRSLYRMTVGLFFAALLVFVLIMGKSVIVPLTIAFFIAFLLIPLNIFLERIHFPRALAAICSLIVFIIGLLGILTLIGTQVKGFSDDLSQITERLTELKSKLPDSLIHLIDGLSPNKMMGMAQEHMGSVLTSLSGFLGSFTVIIIIPIYIILILIYRDHLKEFMYRLFERSSLRNKDDQAKNPEGIKVLIPKIRKIIQKYITGVFYVMLILFVLYSTALISIGIEHAILFAAIGAALNVVPFLGPIIGSALPILFAFVTKDSLGYPFAVLCSYIFIQIIESNILTPKIVGSNVSLNPLVTLLALIIGASIWGLIGMILFIPLIAILREIFKAVDGMEPFAFLLGNPKEDSERSNFFTRLYEKIKNKFQSKSSS